MKFLCFENLKGIDKSNQIYNRSPYMDAEDVIRMRGRIDAAKGVSDGMKRPIILPNDHFHRLYHHVYAETVVNELQQIYSIPKLRVCQRCKNQSAKPAPPEMSDSPSTRLASYTRSFSFIGIDYFGPMTVSVGRRTEKRWGVLITCLTIRPIHIEVAYSLKPFHA